MNEELEVLLVTVTSHMSVITWCCMHYIRQVKGLFSELLLIVMSHLLLLFYPTAAPYLLTFFLMLILAKWHLQKEIYEEIRRTTVVQQKLTALPINAKIPYLTVLRCTTMLSTLICILAVDFKRWFPHRFSKSGMYGASLMDVGVGAMVYTGGLSAGHKLLGHTFNILDILVRCVPLFVLGVGRGFLIKLTGYHTAVSEYGVHWNFFVTLSFLPFILYLGALLKEFGISLPSFATIMMIVYQLILRMTNLERYLLSDYRGSDLLSQNKEGLSSLIGYAAIYLYAAHLGSLHNPAAKKKELTLIALTSLLTYALLKSTGFLASRRIANLPYVLWTMFFTTTHHLISLYASTQYVRGSLPRVAIGMSKYQLMIFLIANLLTGAVNLWMNPAVESARMTAFVMIVYIGELSCLAYYLANSP